MNDDVLCWSALWFATIIMGVGNLLGFWTLSWWIVFSPIWVPVGFSCALMMVLISFMTVVVGIMFVTGLIAMTVESIKNRGR